MSRVPGCGCGLAEAHKPEDWDDEEDGTWEPPQVANPRCKAAGCGPWSRPLKKNPAYKGEWKAPLIDNPDYKVGVGPGAGWTVSGGKGRLVWRTRCRSGTWLGCSPMGASGRGHAGCTRH